MKMGLRIRGLAPRLVLLGLIFALPSCGESPTSEDERKPAALRIISGDGQRAAVGADLPDDIVLRVVDARGRPVPFAIVEFRVLQGGGSVRSASRADDPPGVIRARWRVGFVRGAQMLQARVSGTSLQPVFLHATALSPALSTVRGGEAEAPAPPLPNE